MSEVIVSAFISGICVIIGGIISPIVTHRLNKFSKKEKIEKDNITPKSTTYNNKVRKNTQNIKRILTIISYLILFLLGIIIYIVLFQLLPKTSENKLLNNRIIDLKEENNLLNNKISTYERQINSSQFIEIKMQLSDDARYALTLLQMVDYDKQEHILHIYSTFVSMLDEIENSNDVDWNRIIRNTEQAEEQLQYYREMQQ